MFPMSIVVLDTSPVLGVLFVTAVGGWVSALAHRRTLTWPRMATVVLTCAYGAGILIVTALPPRLALQPGFHLEDLRSLVNVVPLVTLDPPTFLLNILMTVPLGLLLPLVVQVCSVRGAALVGLLVSAAVESAQGLADLLLDLGRTVDVNDLLANVTGSVLGLFCLRVLAAFVGRSLARSPCRGLLWRAGRFSTDLSRSWPPTCSIRTPSGPP